MTLDRVLPAGPRIGGLVSAMLALFLPALAAGAPPTPIDVGTNNAFTLAGPRILLWNDERPGLSVREPDGTVRALHRAPTFKATESVIARVAATESQVAFVTEGYDSVGEGGRTWSSLRAGPFDGPFALISGKEGASGGAEPRDVAISDAGILFSDDRGVALQPAGGGPRVRLGGSGEERIAVNGRYAATRTSEHATAYDLQTRTVVARVAVDADIRSEAAASAGVSAEGTLVYIDAARRLWSLVPATRQRTLLMGGAHEILRVAGSTVYVASRSSGSQFEALRRLWAVDLADGGRRPVTESVFGGTLVTDGARVLYRRDGCTLYGDVPATAPEKAPVTSRCPRQSLNFFVNEQQRRSEVRMRVTCPGAAADRCTGTARLTARRAAGRGRLVLGTWRFDVAGGAVGAHTLEVTLNSAAATRRNGRSTYVTRLRITGSPFGTLDRRIVVFP